MKRGVLQKRLAARISLFVAATAVIHAQNLFPDKSLEAAVRDTIPAKRGTTQPLTKEDVRLVSTIEARGKGIRDLTGIEHCANLRGLDLAGNEIASLAPLAAFRGVDNPYMPGSGNQIYSLDLSKNQVRDLQGIEALGMLQYLDLSGNQVEDLAPLSGLTRLKTLYLSNNNVRNLAPIGALGNLWTLYIDGNRVQDLGPVARLTQLSSLNAGGNEVKDIAPLAAISSLRSLALDKNRITDLSPLVASARKDAEGPQNFAPWLKVSLACNPLTAEAKAKQLPALQKFGVTLLDETRSGPGEAATAQRGQEAGR
jgi:internalin A